MKPTVFVVYYSMHGHVHQLANYIIKGLERTNVNAKLFQIPETLSSEVLATMHAPPKDTSVPVITTQELPEADGILFGIPTRFGGAPAQVRAFFDQCGKLWQQGRLHGKFAGTFFSTSTIAGGQETTALSCIPFFTHVGMIYVPFGYKSPKMGDNSEVHGGSPYGAGTLAGMDNKREVSELEQQMAECQGLYFGNLMNNLVKKDNKNDNDDENDDD